MKNIDAPQLWVRMILGNPKTGDVRDQGNQPGSAVILMYHRIADEQLDPWAICVDPVHFEQQLQCLNESFNPMSLTELVVRLEQEDLPENACVLTFDDGYVDNLDNALPLLKKHDIPATFFITTGYADRNHGFWWDVLEDLILRTGDLPEFLELDIEGETIRWALGECAQYTHDQRAEDAATLAWESNPGSRLRLYFEIWQTLQPRSVPVREEALQAISDWTGVEISTDTVRRAMSSKEINNLGAEDLATIGCHSVSHPLLSRCDVAQQLSEIQVSQQFLQKVTGKTVNHFAYPHGDYSAETIKILNGAGFKSACTVQRKIVQKQARPMALPRIPVENIGGSEFAERLNTLFEF